MKSVVVAPARRAKRFPKKPAGGGKPPRPILDPIDAVVGVLKGKGRRTDDIMRELRGR
ncbi:MAG: hypothetical protein JNK23_16780 [Opitutaceae bacterium]|nr:hypothetical protein [Opitutaceae bacterium]